MTAPNEPTPAARCPWCSAELSDPDRPTCPACGAALVSESAGMGIPGVTEVDPTLRAYEARAATKRPKRTGLLGMLLGQGELGVLAPGAHDDLPPLTGRDVQAIQPPSDDVRKAMLEMELEAAGVQRPGEPDAEAATEQALESATAAGPAAEAEAEPPAEAELPVDAEPPADAAWDASSESTPPAGDAS